MKLLTDYFDAQKKLHDYFGYYEDWSIIPMEDRTDCYWMICGPEDSSSTTIGWSSEPYTKESIEEGEKIYSGTIYTQRHLKKWVYRAPEYTMICVDTHCDGNKILMIFDNAKECKDKELIKLMDETW